MNLLKMATKKVVRLGVGDTVPKKVVRKLRRENFYRSGGGSFRLAPALWVRGADFLRERQFARL